MKKINAITNRKVEWNSAHRQTMQLPSGVPIDLNTENLSMYLNKKIMGYIHDSRQQIPICINDVHLLYKGKEYKVFLSEQKQHELLFYGVDPEANCMEILSNIQGNMNNYAATPVFCLRISSGKVSKKFVRMNSFKPLF